MEKSNEKEKNTIKILSRAQTAKIRKNLGKTFFNLNLKNKSRQKNIILNIPFASYHDYKLSQLSLPPTEYNNENKLTFKEQDEEYQKAHLNEINIKNLFTEKLWEKNNLEKNEDYTKKIAYKKLIMRAKLLKAMKTNIVLRKKEFDEYNTKYYKGSKLLSDKLKNKKRKDSEDSFSDNDDNEKKERPNFISIKQPDIFSEYEYTALFQDYYCSPIELIKKIFNYDEQKIIKLDPIFFRLNKGPFLGIQEKIGFSLKDKIDEEDRILKQKIEKMKELNKRFHYIKKKHKRKNTEIEKNETQKDSTKEISNIKNIKKRNNDNNIKSKTQTNFYFPNNDKRNNNKKKSEVYNFFPLSKNKSPKKRKQLKINVSGIKTPKKDLKFNLNTDYNVYLEIKKNQKKKNQGIINNINYLYKDGEKIKDKKKRLTMEELLDIYNERKKLYLDDLSYNRKKNKYKYEKLRIQKNKEKEQEDQKKETLRKILAEIEDNYKIYQK